MPYAKSILFLSVLCFGLVLILSSCRKNEPFTYDLQGTVHDASTGTPVPNVEVSLYETLLENGSLTSFPQFAESSTTDANGNYAMNFERKNSSEYEIRYSSPHHHSGQFTVNPDRFSPNQTTCISFSVGGISTVRTRLVNTNPVTDLDRIDFRFLNALSPCECCDTSEVSFIGQAVDETWMCGEYSDRWLKYFAEITKVGGGGFVLDSIYCTPLDTVDILITY